MSAQQLLDGELLLNLKQNGEDADSVRFYQNQGAITVMSGGSTVFGVTLSPSEDAATELQLGYIFTDNSFNLESVQLNDA